jgi:hypothetical protein
MEIPGNNEISILSILFGLSLGPVPVFSEPAERIRQATPNY